MANSICINGRKRLDETLNKPELSVKENVRRIVQDKLVMCPAENDDGAITEKDDQRNERANIIVQNHLEEVWETLNLLRSVSNSNMDASGNHGWKLKEDCEQYRVMYREGLDGSPFHTLLVEGFVDGSVESCLSLGVEASLYPHWFPDLTFPTFKVIESRCLKRVRIGEEISLMRLKIPWPLQNRELVFRYFEVEHFKDGLVIVLLKSVTDLKHVDKNIDGFSSDDIPPESGAVRMDIFGGFALQNVDSSKTYFRTVANLDIKLEFVPPSLINFVSRQLMGHGFKLYQKAVIAARDGDKLFCDIIDHEPMYTHIREGLYSAGEESGNQNIMLVNPTQEKPNREPSLKRTDTSESIVHETCHPDSSTSEIKEVPPDNSAALVPRKHEEISSQSVSVSDPQGSLVKNLPMDTEMQKALQVLDDAILFVKAQSDYLTSCKLKTQEGNSIQDFEDVENNDSLQVHKVPDVVQAPSRKYTIINGNESQPSEDVVREINRSFHYVSGSSLVKSKKSSSCLHFLSFLKKRRSR